MPDISIITPCYNAAEHIRQTIESVLSQEGVTVEHIVVDGGSTDGTVEILKSYSHLNWISEKDEGQSDAFNKGLRKATAPLIGWLNADDFYEPGALKQVVDCFHAQPETAIINADLVRVDERDNILEHCPARSSKFGLRHFWLRWYNLNHPSTFYRREVFEQIGEIDTSLQYAMDYDFYLRASQKYDFHDLNVLTTRMLVHPAAKTSQGWDNFAYDVQKTMAKVWKPKHPLFYVYSLLGIRTYAARCHLVESFTALRNKENKRFASEFIHAFQWWPLLPLLPAFYAYLLRSNLRLLLGETLYNRLISRSAP